MPDNQATGTAFCGWTLCLLLTGACVRCQQSASTSAKLATLSVSFSSREGRDFGGITSRPRAFRTASEALTFTHKRHGTTHPASAPQRTPASRRSACAYVPSRVYAKGRPLLIAHRQAQARELMRRATSLLTAAPATTARLQASSLPSLCASMKRTFSDGDNQVLNENRMSSARERCS